MRSDFQPTVAPYDRVDSAQTLTGIRKRRHADSEASTAPSKRQRPANKICERCKEPRDERELIDTDAYDRIGMLEPVPGKHPICFDCYTEASARRGRTSGSECLICTDTKALSEFPSTSHQVREGHGSEICSSCWQVQLRHDLEGKSTEQISCPQCNVHLAEPDIKEIANEEIYQRYLDKAFSGFISQDPDYRTCPSGKCSYGYIHTTREDGNIFRCEMCDARYCVLCEVKMHDGETCEAYQTRLKTENENVPATNEYLVANSKACPRCTTRITKNGGCDHMHCTRCRHDFSWSTAKSRLD